MAELNSIGALITDASILGYWRLEGNSNDAQAVAAQHNGSDTGISYSLANGKYGQGAGFNGTTSKIDFGNVLGFANGTSISISMWAKPAGTADKDVVQKQYNYNFGVRNSGKWSFGYFPGSDQVWDSAQAVDTSAFHHIVVTYTFGTGSSIKMYYDGANITAGGAWTFGDGNSAPPSNSNPLTLSGSAGYFGTFYSGALDDVAIFNRALTSTEVSQLFTAGVLSRNSLKNQAVKRASFY